MVYGLLAKRRRRIKNFWYWWQQNEQEKTHKWSTAPNKKCQQQVQWTYGWQIQLKSSLPSSLLIHLLILLLTYSLAHIHKHTLIYTTAAATVSRPWLHSKCCFCGCRLNWIQPAKTTTLFLFVACDVVLCIIPKPVIKLKHTHTHILPLTQQQDHTSKISME